MGSHHQGEGNGKRNGERFGTGRNSREREREEQGLEKLERKERRYRKLVIDVERKSWDQEIFRKEESDQELGFVEI